MKYNTIREASEAWVNSFNAYPLGMIEKCFNADIDDWHELTPISEGCTVWSNEYQDGAEVIEITENEDGEKVVKICLHDNGEEVETDIDDLSREDDTYFPMCGTMWSFGDSADNYWLEELGGLEIMADCGFRIYESEEFGYFFGIDGAGYSFYEEHWIPLYKQRGLQWHETDEETEVA